MKKSLISKIYALLALIVMMSFVAIGCAPKSKKQNEAGQTDFVTESDSSQSASIPHNLHVTTPRLDQLLDSTFDISSSKSRKLLFPETQNQVAQMKAYVIYGKDLNEGMTEQELKAQSDHFCDPIEHKTPMYVYLDLVLRVENLGTKQILLPVEPIDTPARNLSRFRHLPDSDLSLYATCADSQCESILIVMAHSFSQHSQQAPQDTLTDIEAVFYRRIRQSENVSLIRALNAAKDFVAKSQVTGRDITADDVINEFSALIPASDPLHDVKYVKRSIEKSHGFRRLPIGGGSAFLMKPAMIDRSFSPLSLEGQTQEAIFFAEPDQRRSNVDHYNESLVEELSRLETKCL